MNNKLILLLIFVLVLSACTRSQKSAPESQKTKPRAIVFDDFMALKAIYGEVTPANEGGKTDTVFWNTIDVPKSLSRYFQSTPKGKAQIIFDAPYKEDGIDKRIVLAATVPAIKDYSCHACGLLIGGAVFKRSADGWLVESKNKYIAVEGKWGSVDPESISLLKVGPDHYGVLFRGSDMHQGYESIGVSLLIPYGKSIVESLQFYVEGPTEGVCGDKVMDQRLDLKPARHQKAEQIYYDMEAETRYNDGECGHVKSIQETRRFTFSNGKYKKTK
jgi:hypothetical protein